MEPLRIEAGELTAQEILDELEAGRRIVVRADLFGSEREMTLRHDGETFYCDTPTRLHKHEEQDEMRECIERMGYGKKPEAEAEE
jgi:hemin uptake protein HemP